MMTTRQFFNAISLVVLLSGSIRLACGSAVLIADMTMSVMVELSSRHPFCKMHTDRGDIQRMLLQSDQRRIRQVPRESVMELENVCKDAGSYGREFRGGLGFIYPGTKWCGPGTAAVDYNDLGHHAGEDRCCREHDLCPNVLSAGDCRRGLCNTGAFTRSHCDCDARFRRCLQSLNTETANTLGAIFYNVVQVTCFQDRSPCSAHQRFDSNCPFDFRPSNLYVPPNSGSLISRIIQKQSHHHGFSPRSLHVEVEPNRSNFFGTAAVDYNDLGHHAGEDRCCREHDLCPNVLSAGDCRRGLCNTGAFTRSHCDCDARFRRCLQSLNTETANTLGAIFYNVVQVTCFQDRSPCSAHQRFDSNCPFDFRPSNLYVPPNSGSLISRIIQKQSHHHGFSPRSLHVEVEPNRSNFDSITTRIGVKLASVGLAAVNIFKELQNNWPKFLEGSQNYNNGEEVPINANYDAGENYYQSPPPQGHNSNSYWRR